MVATLTSTAAAGTVPVPSQEQQISLEPATPGTEAQEVNTYAQSPVWDPQQRLGDTYAALSASTSGRGHLLTSLLRQYNHSLPGLRGSMAQAKVLRVTKDEIYVDTLFGVSTVPRSVVDTTHLVVSPASQAFSGSNSGGSSSSIAGSSSLSKSARPEAAQPRRSTKDIRPGDVLSLRIRHPFTPYGDSLLAPVSTSAVVEKARVMSELQEKFARGELVSGRVLNECSGGYAVGIGGVAAFLPYSRAHAATISNVGELAYFKIVSMEKGTQRVVVSDARREGRRRG